MSQQRDDEDSEPVETDPEGRYYRSSEVVGKGRFKQVYKAFDSAQGIDVAWSIISARANNLSPEQLSAIAGDIATGLRLDHPNIIKCFKCWEDPDDEGGGCINLVTELFTSGNLRQYRNLHRHLDLKAVKRMARQILKGLQYLHSMQPPVTHGDLRCDKIYVNGHSGEIKIGDLGLATLLPFRWEDHDQHSEGLHPSTDIFAFGLCMLELITLKHLDPQHCYDWESALSDVADDEATAFISKCLGPIAQRPSALALLDDPFLPAKKAAPEKGPGAEVDLNASLNATNKSMGGSSSDVGMMSGSSYHLHQSLLAPSAYKNERRRTEESGDEGWGGHGGGMNGGGNGGQLGNGMDHGGGGNGGGGNGGGGNGGNGNGGPGGNNSSNEGPIAVGKLRGEDYLFEFHGRVKDGKLHFRLTMTGATEVPGEETLKRTIDFIFDPEVDTADNLAGEISEEFNLSPTDTEICAAALKEWLARMDMPSEDDR